MAAETKAWHMMFPAICTLFLSQGAWLRTGSGGAGMQGGLEVDADPGDARVRNADGCRSKRGQDQEGRWEESV